MIYVRVDYSGDELAAGLRKASRAAETILATQVLKDVRKLMPARTKSLINRSHVEKGRVVVIPGPYARYLDAGKVMVDENGRGPFPTPDGPRYRRGAVLHASEKDLVISTAVNPWATSHFVDAAFALNEKRWREIAEKAVQNGL